MRTKLLMCSSLNAGLMSIALWLDAAGGCYFLLLAYLMTLYVVGGIHYADYILFFLHK